MAKNLRLFISAAAAALLAVLLLPLFDSTWTVLRWSTGVSTDLVVMNATICTSDPSLPFADAMAVRAGRILRVGNYSSMQPDHLLDDANSAEKKIGIARASKGSYLFQSLLTGNVQLAFGSDWPVADINPLRGIQTALTRVPPRWEDAWIPSERVSLSDALNALSPGKYADFVVLDATTWDEFAKQDVSTRGFEAYVNGVQAYP